MQWHALVKLREGDGDGERVRAEEHEGEDESERRDEPMELSRETSGEGASLGHRGEQGGSGEREHASGREWFMRNGKGGVTDGGGGLRVRQKKARALLLVVGTGGGGRGKASSEGISSPDETRMRDRWVECAV